jgi:hypothetical protein
MTRTTQAAAWYVARRHVEEEIRRRGEKVSHYSAKQIYELAEEYLRDHKLSVMSEVVELEWYLTFREFMKKRGRVDVD